jgi:fibronectin-binding autotransporter adhesin
MKITEAEQVQHEYYYRTRLVMPGQQPQWLPDAAYTIGDAATLVALSWSQSLNWIGGIPDASGAVASFFRTNTAARTIALDGSHTVGTLSFTSPNAYTIAPGGAGSLILDNASSNATVTVSQGSHEISAAVQLNGTASVSVAAGSTFTLSGVVSGTGGIVKTSPGILKLTNVNSNNGPVSMNGGIVSVSTSDNLGNGAASNGLAFGGGTLQTSGSFSTSRDVSVAAGGGTIDTQANIDTFSGSISGNANLTKLGAGTLHVTSISLGGLNVSAGIVHVLPSGRLTSSTSVLSSSPVIASGAQLDLEDNALVVNYGNETTGATRDAIRNLLVNGRNAGPGAPATWNGSGGIVSSFAHNNGNGSNLAIGYADNATLASISAAESYTSFGGQVVSSSAILVQMTYGADANLDGIVDGQDVSIVGTHFGKPGSGQWYFGDFDYSGSCDGMTCRCWGRRLQRLLRRCLLRS